MKEYRTQFGTLLDYQKGGVDIIDDDPRHYAFSNMFEVASNAKAWEKVAVAKNMQYVLEVIRAEGTSEWRSAAHDEFALVMDGSVEVELVKLAAPALPPDAPGSIGLDADPAGQPMGRLVCGQGHMALLPANAAYRFKADVPSVILLQTIIGPDTIERWSEICQTS